MPASPSPGEMLITGPCLNSVPARQTMTVHGPHDKAAQTRGVTGKGREGEPFSSTVGEAGTKA